MRGQDQQLFYLAQAANSGRQTQLPCIENVHRKCQPGLSHEQRQYRLDPPVSSVFYSRFRSGTGERNIARAAVLRNLVHHIIVYRSLVPHQQVVGSRTAIILAQASPLND